MEHYNPALFDKVIESGTSYEGTPMVRTIQIPKMKGFVPTPVLEVMKLECNCCETTHARFIAVVEYPNGIYFRQGARTFITYEPVCGPCYYSWFLPFNVPEDFRTKWQVEA